MDLNFALLSRCCHSSMDSPNSPALTCNLEAADDFPNEGSLFPEKDVFHSRKEGRTPEQKRRVSPIFRSSSNRGGNGEFQQASADVVILVAPVSRPKLPRDAVWASGSLPCWGEERDPKAVLTAALRRSVSSSSAANGRQKQENRPVFPWFSSLFPIETCVLITRRS